MTRFSITTTAVVFLSAISASNAQILGLDIPGLLAGLGPASSDDPRFTDFQHPGPNDVRSPCPGLNALANHNFIHRDGRNMSIPHLLTGLAEGMNMGADFAVAIGGAGLLFSSSPATGSFNLDDLNEHNFPIEHDASLSRRDFYFGNNHDFYPPNWQQVLSYFSDQDATTLKTASDAKYSRVNSSMANDPDFTYGLREFIFSYGETAIYLQAMSDPSAGGKANVEYVRSLFEQEKLPYELGWRPSAEPITLLSLGQMVLELYLASPEPVPEGAKVTADSYKDIFELVVGGSKAFAELTDDISSYVGL